MQEPEFRARWSTNQNPKGMSLFLLPREHLRTNGDWTSQGFWALAANRLGNWHMGIR